MSLSLKTCHEISKHLSFLYAPCVFHAAASMLYFCRATCCAISLGEGLSFPLPLGSPGAGLIFKTLAFKFCWF